MYDLIISLNIAVYNHRMKINNEQIDNLLRNNVAIVVVLFVKLTLYT